MNHKQHERASRPNPCPFGTSGMAPADSASRAGAMPEASRDRSLGTFGIKHMNLYALLFVPGAWIAITLPIMLGIGALSPSSFQVHGLPILVSYFLAVPLALICSIFGAFIAYRHFASGHGEKMCFLIHLGILSIGGIFCFIAFNFPRIGPH